jgi:hypothetical protein
MAGDWATPGAEGASDTAGIGTGAETVTGGLDTGAVDADVESRSV